MNRSIHKLVSLLLAVLLMCSMIPAAAAAPWTGGAGTPGKLSASLIDAKGGAASGTYKKDGTVYVALSADAVSQQAQLTAMQFALRYDATALELVEVHQPGDGSAVIKALESKHRIAAAVYQDKKGTTYTQNVSGAVVNPQKGLIRYAYDTAYPISQPGIFAVLQFKVLREMGTTQLTMDTGEETVFAGFDPTAATLFRDFSGSVRFDLDIPVNDSRFDLSKAVAEVEQGLTYTGTAHTPAVQLYTDSTRKNPIPADCVTVTYANNLTPGSAAFTVTVSEKGADRYVGSFKGSFAIGKAARTLTFPKEKLTIAYGDQPADFAAAASAGKDPITYTSSDPKIAAIDKDGKVTPVAVGEAVLTATLPETDLYLAATATAAVTVTPKAAQITVEVLGQYTYTGEPIQPQLEVTADGKKTTAYTTELTDNVEVGKATVTVTLTGDLYGSKTTTFLIYPGELDEAVLTGLDAQTFTGSPLSWEPVVTVGSRTLTPGTDYTLTFANATDAGAATILIKGVGNYAGELKAEAKILPADAESVTLVEPEEAAFDGQPHQQAPTLMLGETPIPEEWYTLRWERDGMETTDFVSPGAITVVVDFKKNIAGQCSGVYAIIDRSLDWGDVDEEIRSLMGFTDIEQVPEGLWVSGVPEEVTYTGAAITLPDLNVFFGTQKLVLGTDYTVKYANNTKVSTEKIRAKVTVTGKGNFTGSQAVEFDIMPYSIEGLSVAPLSANETGKVQKPSPVVTAEVGGKTITLKKGTDYTVVYPGTDTKAPDYNADAFKIAGTHSIQIIGKGNYAGETVCELTLLEKSYINISKATVGKIANAVYDGEPQEPVITLTYSKTPLEEGVDYEVTYKNNVEVGTASVIISGKGDFFGSVTKTFKITGVALSKAKIEGLAVKETYTGEQILGAENAKLYIAATKTAPQIDLVEGVDYTISYTNNVKAGTATVAFVGMGGYTGTVKKTFTIAATNAFEVEPLEAQTYTKGGVKPLPVVKFDGKTLVNGTDYTLTYKNNTKVADLTVKSVPTVTVKGKGNFTGSVAVQFEIVPSGLYNVTATATDIVYANKANICKPTVTVVDTNGSKLAAGTDYEKTITYTYAADTTVTQLVKKEYIEVERKAGDEVDKLDIIPAGTVINATITGKGNYANSVLTVPFRFVQGSLAKATVKITAQTYTGKPIELKNSDMTVKIGKDVLELRRDFVIVGYEKNTDKGTAKVTLRGIDNYGGTKTVNFTIAARKVLWFS